MTLYTERVDVSAYNGIYTYLPESVHEDFIYPHYTPREYDSVIPVAITSGIVLEYQLKFPRFQFATEQSIDDAFPLCKTLYNIILERMTKGCCKGKHFILKERKFS